MFHSGPDKPGSKHMSMLPGFPVSDGFVFVGQFSSEKRLISVFVNMLVKQYDDGGSHGKSLKWLSCKDEIATTIAPGRYGRNWHLTPSGRSNPVSVDSIYLHQFCFHFI